eukprot:g14205.t1
MGARLERVIHDVISDHGLQGPDKQSAEDFTRKELLKLYEHPKVAQLEAVLLKRVTEEEARHILFFPDQDQAAYYPTLVANPPKGAPEEHPQRAVQIPHLSLLYLQHWKRWDFVSAFVLSGGLHALCSLLAHDNPVVRLKAISTLVSITAHRDFDWFHPPPRSRAASPGGVVEANNTTEARLHRALLSLRLDPAFIPGLIANSWGGSLGGDRKCASTATGGEEEEKDGGRSFPGACLMCLELLAMWLSWVRALHTVDGTLRLSRPLLCAIEEWAGKESGPEGRPGWDKEQWVPKLPGMKQQLLQQQQQSQTACGDASLEKDGEARTASGDAEKQPGLTPEMAPDEEEEKVGHRDKVSGTPAAGAASERAPANDHEAEAMMLEAEHEEREKVLELVGKLVADFGRFPPAAQEWEEVADGGGTDGRESLPGNNGEKGDGQGNENARNSGNGGDDHGGAVSASSSPDNAPSGEECQTPTGGIGRHGDGGEVPHGEKARDDGDCTSIVRDATKTSLACPTRKALALKLEGNESYKQGHVEKAREKYTMALGMLDSAGGAASTQAPCQGKTSAVKPGEVSGAEAAVLRGVLHRNRAAAALRLFESKATAAVAARDARVATAHQEGSTGGGTSGTNTGSGDRQQTENGSATGEGNKALSFGGAGERRRLKEAESTRFALESSFALLEECESDCLKAIEVDAGDKKARLRLERCRDLRRRCYRGGLAAAAAGRGGSSTNYSRQDERLQGRKAELVAKILARTEGSHEIVGGAGGGKVSDTAVAPVLTARCKPDAGAMPSMPSDSGENDASVDEKALVCGGGERDTGADIARETALGGKQPSTVDGSSTRDSGLPGQGRKTDHAPWEGSELREAVTPNPNKVAGACAASESAVAYGKKAKSRMAPKAKKGENGDKARARTTKRKTAAVRRVRRCLEQAAARAAAVSPPKETDQEDRDEGGASENRKGWEEAVKEVWDVIVSLPSPSGGGRSGDSVGGLTLEKVVGDGITAELLLGITRGLRYACGIDAARFSAEGAQVGGEKAPRNTERAIQLFLELAAVRRVGLASAMCSPNERLALKDVSDHVRRHLLGASSGGSGGGVGEGTEEREQEKGAGGARQLLAFEAAVSTLGLQP